MLVQSHLSGIVSALIYEGDMWVITGTDFSISSGNNSAIGSILRRTGGEESTLNVLATYSAALGGNYHTMRLPQTPS